MKKTLIGGAIVAVLVAAALAGRVLYDVFSLAGVAYAFGVGDGSNLFAPAATAIVFWVLFLVLVVEVPVLVVRRLDWKEGRLTPVSAREAWFAAHVSAAQRTRKRLQWAMAGWDNYLQQRDRAASLAIAAIGRRQHPSLEATAEDGAGGAVDEDAA